jgi:hypothetical protein
VRGIETIAAAIFVLLTVGLFIAWGAMVRRPGRWNRYLSESFWARALAWVAAIGSAAVLGGLMAGGGRLTAAIFVVVLFLLGVVFVFWSKAKAFGPPD